MIKLYLTKDQIKTIVRLVDKELTSLDDTEVLKGLSENLISLVEGSIAELETIGLYLDKKIEGK